MKLNFGEKSRCSDFSYDCILYMTKTRKIQINATLSSCNLALQSKQVQHR